MNAETLLAQTLRLAARHSGADLDSFREELAERRRPVEAFRPNPPRPSRSRARLRKDVRPAPHRFGLTDRTLAVLLIAEGKPNAEIGVALFISEDRERARHQHPCASSASVPGCKQPRSPSAPECSHRDSLIIDAVCSPGCRAAPGRNAADRECHQQQKITIYPVV